jgi:hypothetical protein
MQHTQHHYIYTHRAAFDADESERACVMLCACRGMPTAAAKALCRRLRIQLLPLDDGISPSPVCNVRFLVALAADSINYYIAWRARAQHADLFLIKTQQAAAGVLFAPAHRKLRLLTQFY